MRHMSFFETQIQVRNKTKTVTRRMGWEFLKQGDLLLPVNKGQGLKPGEHPVILQCPIRIIHNDREPLWMIEGHPDDLKKEGFPALTEEQFIIMFCRINKAKKCKPTSYVNRIEFEYTA
jgi:hypothetical protein